jgi:hypothetical protein
MEVTFVRSLNGGLIVAINHERKIFEETYAFFLAFYKAPVLSQQLALAGCMYSICYTEQ